MLRLPTNSTRCLTTLSKCARWPVFVCDAWESCHVQTHFLERVPARRRAVLIGFERRAVHGNSKFSGVVPSSSGGTIAGALLMDLSDDELRFLNIINSEEPAKSRFKDAGRIRTRARAHIFDGDSVLPTGVTDCVVYRWQHLDLLEDATDVGNPAASANVLHPDDNAKPSPLSAPGASLEARLARLAQLAHAGLITEDECAARRSEILAEV